jgi:hypothetical protein
MLKRILTIFILISGLALIILVSPSMLIAPSGQSLNTDNYLYAGLSFVAGLALSIGAYTYSKRQ